MMYCMPLNALSCASLTVFACALGFAEEGPQKTAEPKQLPKPILRFLGTEDYNVGPNAFTRYKLSVTNWKAFADELFQPSPDLPPAGLNKQAARTFVHIYSADGECLYGFVALQEATNLQKLWFATPAGVPPHSTVFITMIDRRTGRVSTSDPVSVNMAK
jgi:hypothetical protein